jgi:hypothetical protein
VENDSFEDAHEFPDDARKRMTPMQIAKAEIAVGARRFHVFVLGLSLSNRNIRR